MAGLETIGPSESQAAIRAHRPLAGLGFVFAAIASACCWVSIVLGLVGVTAGGISATSQSLGPAAMVVMIGALTAAAYTSWKKIGRIDGVVWLLAVVAVDVALHRPG